MNKTEIIQKIIDKVKARTYLEIGVASGGNFFAIKTKTKIAVDPKFGFSQKRKLRWMLLNPSNFVAQYYEIESNSFFADKVQNRLFDVVFIDGLHTYQQALEDINNALKYLTHRGVIIVHDCYPPNEAAAYPADSYEHARLLNLPGWTGAWCGDVWKAICHLRSSRNDLRIFVIDRSCGLGVITRGIPEKVLHLSDHEINQMTYTELTQDKFSLLNLKDEAYLPGFLETL